MKNTTPVNDTWFDSVFGRWVMATEYRICTDIVGNVLGLYGGQLGAVNPSLISPSPVRHQWLIGRAGKDICADWRCLPFASESFDLLLLAHALEATTDARAVLREAVRVLRPEGHLVIIGFNPWGWLALSQQAPWRRRWLSVPRLKDWLALLDMQPVASTYAVFLPPWRRWYKQRQLRCIEQASRRWLPLTGGVFFLHTIKHRYSVRLVVPAFKQPVKKILVGAGAEKTDIISPLSVHGHSYHHLY